MKLPIFDVINETAMSSDFDLSSDQDFALANMRTCRTPARGGQILGCQDCKLLMITYNPCNQRGCPTCCVKNQIKWKVKLQKKLLNVNHYHLVFSIPDAYTFTWLIYKKALSECLFSCVSESLKEIGKEYKLLLGFVLAFQSHGKGICYKPHIHCILSAGGLSEDKKWIETGSIPYTKLAQKLQEKFLQKLQDFISLENIPLKEKVDSRQWKVHPTVHQKTGKWIVEYLSHSITGVVLNMHQKFIIDRERKTIGFTETHAGKVRETILSTKIFTERYLNHIPPSGEVIIRYYGLYSNLHKCDLEELRKNLGVQDEVEEEVSKLNKCPICEGQIFVLLTFEHDKLPLYIKFAYPQGPPEHGEIIRQGIKNS